jgi:hypothetical protein
MSETYTPSADNCLLGSGKVYLAVIGDDGVRGAYYHMGDVSNFAAQPTDERAEHRESQTEAQGVYAEALRSRTVELSMTCWEWNKRNLSLAFMGEESTFTQSAATTTETLTTALALGATYFSSSRNATITSISGGAALTATTDYSLVDSTGVFGVTIAPTSTAATAGSPLIVVHTRAAITGTQQPIVNMFTKGKIYASIKFVGVPVAGPKYEAHYHKVSLKPGQIAGLISDDFSSFDLQAVVMTDTVGSYGGSIASPYGTLYRR